MSSPRRFTKSNPITESPDAKAERLRGSGRFSLKTAHYRQIEMAWLPLSTLLTSSPTILSGTGFSLCGPFNRLARGCGLTHPQAGRGRHAIYMVNRVSGEGNATPAYRCRRNNAYLIACPAPPQMRSTARLSSSLFDLSSRADPVPFGFASGHAPSRDQPVAIFFVARGQRRAGNLPRAAAQHAA